MSFADPDLDDKDDLNAKVEEVVEEPKAEEVKEAKEDKVKEEVKEEVNIDEVINSIDNDDSEEEKTETRGRKKISGISDVFTKLIKEDKIVPFDDDKSLDDYTVKDWEELTT